MNRNRVLTIVFVALIMLFGIHVISLKTEPARLDLTEDNLYSLTQGSKDILAKMKSEGVKPIDIKLYFSLTAGKSLPKFIKNFITYENYIRNLLKEYERNSDGKIRLQFIDPVTDSDEAQDAADYGLDGKPINQHGDIFYFGLVFETQTGTKDVIDFLWPEKQETVEYEISKRIYSLLWPSKKRLGIISSVDPIADNSNPYMMQMLQAQGKQPKDSWLITKLLEEDYSVSKIGSDVDSISHDDYDLVLVIHPKNLSDKTLWAIDEWVVTGGKTLVMLDPYSITDQAPQNPQQPWAQLQYKPASNLDKLLNKWGLRQPEDTFTADLSLAVKRAGQDGFAQNVVVDLMIDQSNMAKTVNTDSPIFQGLNEVRFFLAGHLEKTSASDTSSAASTDEGEEKQADTSESSTAVKATPLISTTPNGATITIKPGFGGGSGDELAYTDLNQPGKLQDAMQPSAEPLVLAYLLTGQMPSAFPEGATFPESTPEPPPGMPPGFQMPPDENAAMITKEAVPADQKKEASVIVFADVDFISDQLAFQQSFFGVQAANDNHKVLLNSIDFLLGSKELMNVRSRHNIRRPFELFDAIEARADQRLLSREREIRADIARFQEEIREKQGGSNQKNAALFQKKLADEVDALNKKVAEANRELREIRKIKRAEIESEEAFIQVSTMWMMPALVFILGLILFFRRKQKEMMAKQGGMR